jgi:uncharacterized delta-60 repeat protein
MRSLAHRWTLLPVLIGVACAFPGSTVTAQASAAHLDRGFGSGGIRFLSSSLRETTGVALLGDGRVLVGGESALVALLPSGRIDSGFGKKGYARIKEPPNGSVEPSTVAVDRRDRPVEVGSLFVEPKGEGLLTEPSLEPFIERFTPAGKVDRGFGGGDGYVVSDLGLPASADGEPPESFLTSVAFDAASRLVVGGQSRIDVSSGEGGISQVRKAFLARLDASGELDRSFASGGIFSPSGTERIVTWELGPGSKVSVATSKENVRSILRLGEDGVPEGRFGNDGHAPNPFGSEYASLLVDPRERTIAYTYVEGVEHRLPNGILLRRLRPDGSLDRGFGKGGIATVRIPRFYTAALALDPRGRILLAVSLKERGPVGESNELALVRLRTDGEVDKSFGHDGMIRIPFPGKPNPAVYLEGIDVRGGRAAIGASYCGSGECRPTVVLVDLGSG